jgi:hypothetical protein
VSEQGELTQEAAQPRLPLKGTVFISVTDKDKPAIKYKIPYITTPAAARAGVVGIAAAISGKAGVKSLQSYHQDIR